MLRFLERFLRKLKLLFIIQSSVFHLVCSCTSCVHFTSCVVHVFLVASVTLHAIAITCRRKTKESTAQIRVDSISLVEFSRLDGKIKVAQADERKVKVGVVLYETALGLEKM